MEVYNPVIDEHLTKADKIVLKNLFLDIRQTGSVSTITIGGSTAAATTKSGHTNGAAGKLVNGGNTTTTTYLLSPDTHGDEDHSNKTTLKTLEASTDSTSSAFEPTVYSTWDPETLPSSLKPFTAWYTRVATRVVRRPTDVVFLTHIIVYLTTALPSALYLYYHWTVPHAIFHHLLTTWCAGAFTLMLHNHIHNNGILAKDWWLLDTLFPYIISPLMGHTWNSYYHHHVKMHHVEGNGPGDLSSTIRYQRDSLPNFLHYVGRFLFFVWIELPYYFYRKGKYGLVVRSAAWELTSYGLIWWLLGVNKAATVSVLVLPLVQMRIGMMVGNWGQHALVDEMEPKSDFRSSITLIDVPSNRYCFNDGYHTSHHLNPRRHWRDHPAHFIKSKSQYTSNGALVFKDTDYIMMTVRLLRKDYKALARCLVPIGEEQCRMTQTEVEDFLRTKTRRFSEEEILKKFGRND